MARTLFALLLAFALPAAAAADSGTAALYERLSAQVALGWDETAGAFAEKSGLPSTAAVELALEHSRAEDGALWRTRAARTMQFTWTMFDSVGGGFVHLPKHADPAHPGFDKRTDSNAARLGNLVDLMEAGAGAENARRAAKVVDYFERVLLDGRGGFMPGQVGDRHLLPDVNGLAIHAWLRWCAATGDVRRRDFALRSLDRLWTHAWDDDFGLMRKGDFGEITAPPQLVDQAEAGRAALLAARVVGRDGDLQRAVRLGDLVLAHFADEKRGGFRTRSVPDGKGGFKKAPVVLAENARTARFLCELSAATGDARYRDAARGAWEALADRIAKETLGAADWALAVRESFAPAAVARAEWPEPAAAKPKPRSKRYR